MRDMKSRFRTTLLKLASVRPGAYKVSFYIPRCRNPGLGGYVTYEQEICRA